MTATRFELHRDVDTTGASGTGIVADGLRLTDGRTVVRWRGDRSSTVLWGSYADAVAVHGHDGCTRFVDTAEVSESDEDGLISTVDAIQLAAGMAFAGPCLDRHPTGAVCHEPKGHIDWPSLGSHVDESGGEWMFDHPDAST